MKSLDTILSRLQKVQQRASGYTACCPAHEDKHASLSIGTGENGKVLLKCHADCTFDVIVKAMGLKPSDLMGEGRNTPSNHTATPHPSGCTLAQYAELKRIPVNFLQEVGCRDVLYRKTPALRISYRSLTGQEVAVQYRIALHKGEQGGPRFRWKKGNKCCLYGQWRLDPKPAFIVLVEGPSDCHTLWFHNIPALGIPSASIFKEDWTDALEGIPLI